MHPRLASLPSVRGSIMVMWGGAPLSVSVVRVTLLPSADEFEAFSKKHAMLLFPAFKMQQQMRAKVLGGWSLAALKLS